jgi:hypothetical protein
MKGDVDGAISAYKQALALNPKLSDPHAGLANMYAEQDRATLDCSLAELHQLAAGDPLAGHIVLTLVLAEYAEPELRKPKEAIQSG